MEKVDHNLLLGTSLEALVENVCEALLTDRVVPALGEIETATPSEMRLDDRS